MFKRSFALWLLGCAILGVVPAVAATPLQFLQARLDAIHPESAAAFVPSYDVAGTDPHDLADGNAAYTYDEALVLLALLSSGDTARARRIGDALVWAQGHDRFYHDGRLRNAYAAGTIDAEPVRLPGYWSKAKNKWIEDSYQVGSATGNQAWAGIALLRLSTATGDRRYAETARGIGRFLLNEVGAEEGFRGGFEGFEPNAHALTWRSTEHNADALAFLGVLDTAYQGEGFGTAADQVRAFIDSMWQGDRFAVGTLPDGKTINGYSSLDAQTFTILALCCDPGDAKHDPNFGKAMAYLERTHGVPGGFDYSDAKAGLWPEGTLQAALVYKLLGDAETARALIDAQAKALTPQGGLYAIQGKGGAPLDRLDTKLRLGNGEGLEWYYYHRIHVAPVAWLVMAQAGYNPLADAAVTPAKAKIRH